MLLVWHETTFGEIADCCSCYWYGNCAVGTFNKWLENQNIKMLAFRQQEPIFFLGS